MHNSVDVKKVLKAKSKNAGKFIPAFVVKYLERIVHQEEINNFLKDNHGLRNQDFCKKAVEYLNLKIEIDDISKIPKHGACCVAMNHPLGGIDGISFMAALIDYRKDIVFIANDILMSIEPLTDMFFAVNKHGKNPKEMYSRLDDLFQTEKLICFFPSGLVSRKNRNGIKDLIWKKTFVTYSLKHNVPILPIYIEGKLSNFFYRIANLRKFLRIKTNIEMLYLVDEMIKQKNSIIKFTVGDIISSSSLNTELSHQKLADIIKEKVYNLAK